MDEKNLDDILLDVLNEDDEASISTPKKQKSDDEELDLSENYDDLDDFILEPEENFNQNEKVEDDDLQNHNEDTNLDNLIDIENNYNEDTNLDNLTDTENDNLQDTSIEQKDNDEILASLEDNNFEDAPIQPKEDTDSQNNDEILTELENDGIELNTDSQDNNIDLQDFSIEPEENINLQNDDNLIQSEISNDNSLIEENLQDNNFPSESPNIDFSTATDSNISPQQSEITSNPLNLNLIADETLIQNPLQEEEQTTINENQQPVTDEFNIDDVLNSTSSLTTNTDSFGNDDDTDLALDFSTTKQEENTTIDFDNSQLQSDFNQFLKNQTITNLVDFFENKSTNSHLQNYFSLLQEVRINILKHLIFYLFYTIRNQRYNEFVRVVLSQTSFLNKTDKPDSNWRINLVKEFNELVNSFFKPLNLFNLQWTISFDDFISTNSSSNIDNLINLISQTSIKIDNLFKNSDWKLNFSSDEILQCLSSNYNDFKKLTIFSNRVLDFNSPIDYLKYIGVDKPESWFNIASNLNKADVLIWNGFDGTYESSCLMVQLSMLYHNFGIWNYLIKHPSVSMNLINYTYEDTNFNFYDISALRKARFHNINPPILMLYYENTINNLQKLSQSNIFIEFVSAETLMKNNSSFEKINLNPSSSYSEVIAKSKTSYRKMQQKTFNITQLYHFTGDSEETLLDTTSNIMHQKNQIKNTLNNYLILQLTSYNPVIRLAEYCLIFNDNETDKQVITNQANFSSSSNTIASLDNQEQELYQFMLSPNYLDLSPQKQKEIEDEYIAVQTKNNEIMNQNLLLKPINALTSFNEIYSTLNKIIYQITIYYHF